MARRTPFRQLSKSQQARIRRFAEREGVSIRQVRASTELSQRARGHRPPPGQRESAVRIAKERQRAATGGPMTDSQRKQMRAWFEKEAVRLGYDREDGTRTYREVLGTRKEPGLIGRPFSDFEQIRDAVGNTADMYFRYPPPRGVKDTDEGRQIVSEKFIEKMNEDLGLNLDTNMVWRLVYGPHTPQAHEREAA